MAQVLYVILASIFVIALAYLTLRIMRSITNRGTGSGHLEVIEVVPLNRKSRIVLVRSTHQYLVLGVTENNITLLSELTEIDDSAFEDMQKEDITIPEEFSNRFDKLFSRFKQSASDR